MAHIPIKLYNTRPKEIVLVDNTKTLQEAINKGWISLNQNSTLSSIWTTQNNTTTYPYSVKTFLTSSLPASNYSFWCIISIQPTNINPRITSCKTYFKGSVYCNRGIDGNKDWCLGCFGNSYGASTPYFFDNAPWNTTINIDGKSDAPATGMYIDCGNYDRALSAGRYLAFTSIEKISIVDIEY